MSERIWDRFLSERDKRIFALAGYGARQGFGRRPAVLVVDVNYAFCGHRREPIEQSVKTWRQSAGEAAWDALPVIEELITVARSRGLPVIYTTDITREDKWDRGGFGWKNRRNAERPAETNLSGSTIVPQIAPMAGDIVIRKQKPSAFHGTNLLDYLILLQCDSLIVAGTATSGCVRATVVDAFSHNLRATLVEEACFDRSEASHAINLCDMNAKYADVLPFADVRPFLESLEQGLFELPPGMPAST